MKAYDKLRKDIKDAVADEIPVNLVCPYCQRDFDFESVIDKDSKIGANQWNIMAEQVVGAVIDSIPSIIKEVLNK